MPERSNPVIPEAMRWSARSDRQRYDDHHRGQSATSSHVMLPLTALNLLAKSIEILSRRLAPCWRQGDRGSRCAKIESKGSTGKESDPGTALNS